VQDEEAGTALREQVGRERARVVDQLRSAPLSRLGRPDEAGQTPADAARALSQWAADAAAVLEGEPARPVPRLGDLVVGDQLAVTTGDLLAALGRAGSGDAHDEVLPGLGDRLAALRRLL
jgi:hypothetical protein